MTKVHFVIFLPLLHISHEQVCGVRKMSLPCPWQTLKCEQTKLGGGGGSELPRILDSRNLLKIIITKYLAPPQAIKRWLEKVLGGKKKSPKAYITSCLNQLKGL